MFKPFTLSGVGLHSGDVTTVKISPANREEGRFFVRVDLPNQPVIKASIESVSPTMLSTELTNGDVKIRTVEHLLAALWGCGIEGARIEIDGSEVPLLDGSAQEWVKHIELKDDDKVSYSSEGEINEAIWVRKDDGFCVAFPSPEMKFSCGVDYPYPVLQNLWYSWYPQRETFQDAIAPARTFGFADQIEMLKSKGLIKGGSLENALVCDYNGWLNPPLRFENEAVRHKLLDFIGDLSLLGNIPRGHYLAYKASHQLHTELARKIVKG
ncbi:UDP-3-O-acyl-N-acetylglucosamine deacetylase [Cyanobacterium aponinum]|uniref:UDP-3-O-acyl-N-acetylglucosamine deacetylase n=1 Tax=Cyanobacterium aponinum 0216 TaxID=2676140 RepID=A0A844GMF9_9CHRO|nr:UDP-3-O-acyl-N-acetylglucosamine deacetylase [Cyanobacterium aponinum]MTF37774.1 UDP-3-O-acyl-N-acetylglucosamine deacetylase [Cyanobacterium aponinum 0216]